MVSHGKLQSSLVCEGMVMVMVLVMVKGKCVGLLWFDLVRNVKRIDKQRSCPAAWYSA